MGTVNIANLTLFNCSKVWRFKKCSENDTIFLLFSFMQGELRTRGSPSSLPAAVVGGHGRRCSNCAAAAGPQARPRSLARPVSPQVRSSRKLQHHPSSLPPTGRRQPAAVDGQPPAAVGCRRQQRFCVFLPLPPQKIGRISD